jgi:hypothetical protein
MTRFPIRTASTILVLAWVSFPANAAQQVGVGHCPRGTWDKCLDFCDRLPPDKYRGGTKGRCFYACWKNCP